MKQLITIVAFILSVGLCAQTKVVSKSATKEVALINNNKADQDKAAIKSMSGIYKVSFNFAETFATDSNYKYYPRYKEWGIEYVFVAEETANKIVLQHLLIINDTIIIKHWRQDWVYENKEVYKYYKDNEWIREVLSAEQVKGTWTQKVYQVDDSPRYESYGTWVHIDGKHYWEGTNDAPLPRREFTKRDDYNVMRRHSRMEILSDGWMLEQDNEKIVRNNGIDKTICWEKGMERFTKGNYNAIPAQKWWEAQKKYWADVRKTWDEVYTKNPDLKLMPKVNDKRLYEDLFELGDKVSMPKYVEGSAIPEIRKIIEAFVRSA